MANRFLFFLSIISTFLHPISSFSPLIASVTAPKHSEQLRDVEDVVREKLERIVSGYDVHTNKVIRTMEMEIELSEKTERCLLRGSVDMKRNKLLSERIRSKRKTMEDCLAVNNLVVQQLLLGGPDGEINHGAKVGNLFQSVQYIETNKDGCQLMGNGGVNDESMRETEGYDTAQQVITHTARDWASGSSPCRDATNGWIIQAIVDNCSGMNKVNVLVPGSGLGRLAYDVSTCADLLKTGTEVCVEANDSSVTMAFAAQSVLNMVQKQAVSKMHPFVSDPQRNEIFSTKRFEMDVFPDEESLVSYRQYNSIKNRSPNLTYTVGDFSSIYSQNSKRRLYNVVATSFFIDTASNIYQYIFIMKHLLQKDKSSIWVNCGPVQWHPCAMLRPTVDELKDILEACGFDLITWEIAPEAVAYRHPDDCGAEEAQYTREEGYRPLRFVARLSEDQFDESPDDLHLRIEYVDYLNEVANGKVKEQ